jgi:hypothetical protein
MALISLRVKIEKIKNKDATNLAVLLSFITPAFWP